MADHEEEDTPRGSIPGDGCGTPTRFGKRRSCSVDLAGEPWQQGKLVDKGRHRVHALADRARRAKVHHRRADEETLVVARAQSARLARFTAAIGAPREGGLLTAPQAAERACLTVISLPHFSWPGVGDGDGAR